VFRRQKESESTPEQFASQLLECRKRTLPLLETVDALLYFLKEFSFDITEIDSAGFKKSLDEFGSLVKSDESGSQVSRGLARCKKLVLDFVSRKRSYINRRESELKSTIELLRDGLIEVMQHDREFNAQIYESQLRMEKVGQLDDIIRIKEGIKAELAEAKDVIRKKQTSDETRVQALSKEVDILRSSLEEVRDASMIDPVTGAYNRLGFESHVSRYLDANRISGRRFSLLMCDIDDFKQTNDVYGHTVGDLVLERFVTECRAAIRQDDVIARYGGDEFVVMLPGASLRNAVRIARNICRALSGSQYIVESPKGSYPIRFTISIGVTEARESDTAQSLVERADGALYTAKHTGKNRAASERDIKNAPKAPKDAQRDPVR